jgi:hypothetical protein
MFHYFYVILAIAYDIIFKSNVFTHISYNFKIIIFLSYGLPFNKTLRNEIPPPIQHKPLTT